MRFIQFIYSDLCPNTEKKGQSIGWEAGLTFRSSMFCCGLPACYWISSQSVKNTFSGRQWQSLWKAFKLYLMHTLISILSTFLFSRLPGQMPRGSQYGNFRKNDPCLRSQWEKLSCFPVGLYSSSKYRHISHMFYKSSKYTRPLREDELKNK